MGIDSDGCVFDTMEIKQNVCIIPNIIKCFRLEPISKWVRAAAEFVNLNSIWRGINRFPGLTKTVKLLRDWPEAMGQGTELPDLASLQRWIDSGAPLSNAGLEVEVARTGDPVLKQALEWSRAVNCSVAAHVAAVRPFTWFQACVEKLAPKADIICISVASCEALERQWKDHHIARYAAVIAGQEMGGKEEQLKIASGGRYAKNCVLMIGDAPGDLAAARAIGALFFPINPGHEEQSWERFYREGMERFFRQSFAGSFEASLVEEFEKLLPETPPWKGT